ncbi:hypothetical protein RRG08_037806 [Elysia crispata]|uniref:SH3 domain-containing protein n=1 Tax=Elysia crispata TaxID=231223 RepID=A0AAE1BC90_9GAST|nr:hypothetical protein RRG08_037806 [Elysia crispata]
MKQIMLNQKHHVPVVDVMKQIMLNQKHHVPEVDVMKQIMLEPENHVPVVVMKQIMLEPETPCSGVTPVVVVVVVVIVLSAMSGSGFHNFSVMMVKLVQWRSRNKRASTSSLEDSTGLPYLTTQVLEDHSATSSKEVSVQRGTQVEVVDPSPPGCQDWCLVRTLPPDGADSAQGLVPTAVLRPVSFLSGGRNSIDGDDTFGSADGTSSPVSKRRSSFKKWLTTPVRKLSHGKIEKAGGMLLDPQRAMQRKQGLGAHQVSLTEHCVSTFVRLLILLRMEQIWTKAHPVTYAHAFCSLFERLRRGLETGINERWRA